MGCGSEGFCLFVLFLSLWASCPRVPWLSNSSPRTNRAGWLEADLEAPEWPKEEIFFCSVVGYVQGRWRERLGTGNGVGFWVACVYREKGMVTLVCLKLQL